MAAQRGFRTPMAQIQRTCSPCSRAELLSFRYDPGRLGAYDSRIAITHCGILPQRSAPFIANDWGHQPVPFIPGHETSQSLRHRLEVRSREGRQRVGLGWQSNSCGHCEWCLKGLENLALKQKPLRAPQRRIRRSGPRNNRFVVPIPTPSTANMPRRCSAPARSTSAAH